jgi:hypothetical protein
MIIIKFENHDHYIINGQYIAILLPQYDVHNHA